jgi:type IV secretion system protein VirB10
MSSDSPGPFVAQVNQDIYNYSGSCVEIPYGSRLLGDYDAQVSMGQSKIPARVYRVIYPDGTSANVGNSAPAADQNGEAGIGGRVNRHVIERFVNGLIIGISGVAAQSVSGLPYGSAFINGPQQAVNSAAAWGLSIPPTIEPDAGKRFTLIVTKDWVLRPWSCDGRRFEPQLPIMSAD